MSNQSDGATPAPPPQESSGWGWGGFLSNLTSQAASLVDSYVEDIKEFGTTIRQDTSAALDAVTERANTATAPTRESLHLNDLTQGISSFMSGVTELAQGVATELSELRPARTPSPTGSSDSTSLTASQIQEKMNTQDERDFKEWLKSFDLASKTAETTSLLANNSAIFSLHQQLVPGDLSSEEFWGRYYFKLEQAAKKEEKRLQLLDKTKKHLASPLDESEYSWDDLDEPTADPSTSSAPASSSEEPVEAHNTKSSTDLTKEAITVVPSSEVGTTEVAVDAISEEPVGYEVIEKSQASSKSRASSEAHTPSSGTSSRTDSDVGAIQEALSAASLDGTISPANNPPSPPPPTPASVSSSSPSVTPQEPSTPQATSPLAQAGPLEPASEKKEVEVNADSEDVFDWN